MKPYIVLRRPAPSREGFRTKSMEAGLPPAPKMAVETLSGRDVVDLARDRAVVAIAPPMPTALIRPLAATDGDGEAEWGIKAVGAETSPFTGADVTIAILDTGIANAHPAFAGVQITERDFSGDGDGDRQGHGTHCAGTILGRSSGPRIGVAPGVERALIGKVLKDDGAGGSEMLFEALQWAADNGANIISMSLGFDFPGMVGDLVAKGWPIDLATSTALEAYRGNLRMFDAIMGMFRARAPFGGVPLVVAAAGNESRRSVDAQYRIAASLPAASQDVISVAAVGPEGEAFRVADFSNSLPVVSAPGVNIQSAASGGGLQTMSGTSMACPHVAGVAALWWQAMRQTSVRPSAANVAAKLMSTANSQVFGAAFDESDLGQGLVHAPQAGD